MSLYKLFTTPVEIQYKGYFLSKAMLFILTTAMMNIILPFIIAYRSRGNIKSILCILNVIVNLVVGEVGTYCEITSDHF